MKVDFFNVDSHDTFRQTIMYHETNTLDGKALMVSSIDENIYYLNDKSKLHSIFFLEDYSPKLFYGDQYAYLHELPRDRYDLYIDYICIKSALVNKGLINKQLHADQMFLANNYINRPYYHTDIRSLMQSLETKMDNRLIGLIGNIEEVNSNLVNVQNINTDSFVVLWFDKYTEDRFNAFWEAARNYLGGLELVLTIQGNYEENMNDYMYHNKYFVITRDTAEKIDRNFEQICRVMADEDLKDPIPPIRNTSAYISYNDDLLIDI